MEKNETSDKVNAIWTTINGNATVTFPSGLNAQFDLKKLNKEVLFLFGGKKWLQNESASCKTDEDKIATMKASFKEAVEKGLETTETGKVRIIGSVRSNAGNATALKTALGFVELLTKKVSGVKLSAEEELTLKGLMERAAKK